MKLLPYHTIPLSLSSVLLPKLRDDSDVFQAQIQAEQREEADEKLERGKSGESRWSFRKRMERERRELRWVQVGFDGKTKGLIRIECAHERRRRVPDRGSSIGKGAMTVCGINPGNNE